MLEKLPDWYRVVNIAPSHDVLVKREEAVRKALAEIAGQGEDTLLEIVSGVASGFDHEAPVATKLLQVLRETDRSISADPRSSAMELRVCAAILLGEMLAQGRRNLSREEPGRATLVAAFSVPGFEVRVESFAKQRFFKEMIEQLLREAQTLLGEVATRVRGRRDIPAECPSVKAAFQKIEAQAASASTGTALWAVLRPELEGVLAAVFQHYEERLKTIEMQARSDHEELEVLWWLYSGLSKTGRQRFAEMKIGQAALLAGYELASIVAPPPLSNVREILTELLKDERKKDALKATKVSDFVRDWDISSLPRLDQKAKTVVVAYPNLLPVCWLVERVRKSGVTTGWETEFVKRTGVVTTASREPFVWAEQVMRELMAVRLLKDAGEV